MLILLVGMYTTDLHDVATVVISNKVNWSPAIFIPCLLHHCFLSGSVVCPVDGLPLPSAAAVITSDSTLLVGCSHEFARRSHTQGQLVEVHHELVVLLHSVPECHQTNQVVDVNV